MIASSWCACALVVRTMSPSASAVDSHGALGPGAVPIEDAVKAPPVDDGAPPVETREAPVETDAATEDAAAPGEGSEAPAASSSPSETPPQPVPSPSLAAGGAVEPHPAIVGGYWDLERAHGREPDDGREHIIVGSILLPLGIIAASSSAATVWLSTPGHCKERWAAVDASPTAQQCRGTYVFGIIRVAYGSLMVVTGATLLGIGMHRRERHRQWSRRQSLVPYFGTRGGGLAWTLRFGGRG